MYAAVTERGKYAVKVLNPAVMKREKALENTIFSEIIARELSKKIPPFRQFARMARRFWHAMGVITWFFHGKVAKAYSQRKLPLCIVSGSAVFWALSTMQTCRSMEQPMGRQGLLHPIGKLFFRRLGRRSRLGCGFSQPV